MGIFSLGLSGDGLKWKRFFKLTQTFEEAGQEKYCYSEITVPNMTGV